VNERFLPVYRHLKWACNKCVLPQRGAIAQCPPKCATGSVIVYLFQDRQTSGETDDPVDVQWSALPIARRRSSTQFTVNWVRPFLFANRSFAHLFILLVYQLSQLIDRDPIPIGRSTRRRTRREGLSNPSDRTRHAPVSHSIFTGVLHGAIFVLYTPVSSLRCAGDQLPRSHSIYPRLISRTHERMGSQ